MKHMTKKSTIISKKTHSISNFIEILSKESRFKILLYLIAYPELSLSDLSDHINKSKATAHRDLKEMISMGIVKELRQDPSTKSKFYCVEKDFFFSLIKTLSTRNNIEKMTTEEREKTFFLIITMVKNAFFILENSIALTHKYLDYFARTKENIQIQKPDTILQWIQELDVSIRFLPLSQKTFPKYIEKLTKFATEINEELLSEELKEELFEGDYIAWNVVLPLKKILR